MKGIGFSGKNSKNAARFVVAFALCIVVLGILCSCVHVQSIASQRRLKSLLTSLPEPEGVVLLNEVTGVGGGSDERCYTAFVYRLYGSDRTADEIFAFFQDTLVSRGGWEHMEQRSSGRTLVFHNRKDGFRLSIDYNIESYAIKGFAQFSEQSIAEARRQFVVPFVVVVNHADSVTRENCWPGWEPSPSLQIAMTGWLCKKEGCTWKLNG